MPDGVGFNPAVDAAIQRQKAFSAAVQGAGALIDKKQVKQEKTAIEHGIDSRNDDMVQINNHNIVMEDGAEDNILAAEMTNQLDDSISDKGKLGRRTNEENDLLQDQELEMEQKKARGIKSLTVDDPGAAAKDKLKMANLLGVRKKIDLEKLAEETGSSPEGIKAALNTVEAQLQKIAEEAEKLSLKDADGRGELKSGRLANIGGAVVELAPIAEKTTPLFQKETY